MPKVKLPPVNLDQYLKGREHHYVSYEDGARMCGLPYWGFVRMAKEAEATWTLRKTSMVEKKGSDMKSRKRMEIQTMEELVGQGKKKYVRYAEGAELYSVGKHTFEKWAKDANAIRKVNGVVLVNTEKIDAFIEGFEEEY